MRMQVSELHQLFHLDAPTGRLTWRNDGHCHKAGIEPGWLDNRGYRRIEVGQHRYLAHHIVWAMTHGDWPPNEVDHRNNDRTNNCADNLRDATRMQNAKNRRMNHNNKSGVKGVRYIPHAGKYQATIQADNRRMHLGMYVDIELAELVRGEAERIYFGEFRRQAA